MKFTLIAKSELLVFSWLLRVAVKLKVAVVFDKDKSFVDSENVKVFVSTLKSDEEILSPEIYCTVMLPILYLVG